MEIFIFDLSLLLVGAAVLAYLAVIFKQPIIMAYILCGVLIGPWGTKWINHIDFIETISHLGITLLLFLAGLCLHPQRLIKLFKSAILATSANCVLSFIIAFLFSLCFHFPLLDSICIGLALMFSSTILVVKLLPTTALHQEKMGGTCIGVLIMQDLLAIAVLVFMRCLDAPQGAIPSFSLLSLKLCLFIILLIAFEYFVLRRIMMRVDRLHEVLFILGLAWCFGIARISHSMGLFYETGAFFAGVVMARHPVSRFISESLKPLRDFFLVLFFFTLGAKLDLFLVKDLLFPAGLLALIFILFKPLVFKWMFMFLGETKDFSTEAGIRLGQLSEFSLLVALLALELGHISSTTAQFIQLVTIFTFIASSYIVVFKYPTPIGVSEKLIRT